MEQDIRKRIDSCEKLLIGLGEEWKYRKDDPARNEKLLGAYEVLYRWVREKDYFIITMATDAKIYETALGSRQETAYSSDNRQEEIPHCGEVDSETLAVMDQLFPPKDSRWERIVAPMGNETWRQCSQACTKDIWEPGEIPDDICPHCGAPLTGNTKEAGTYIEEGYLPQWRKYTQWLAGSLNRETLILELGVGFANPGVIRFPFEKTAFFNQKAFLCRVNGRLPQIAQELQGRAVGIGEDSVEWVLDRK